MGKITGKPLIFDVVKAMVSGRFSLNRSTEMCWAQGSSGPYSAVANTFLTTKYQKSVSNLGYVGKSATHGTPKFDSIGCFLSKVVISGGISERHKISKNTARLEPTATSWLVATQSYHFVSWDLRLVSVVKPTMSCFKTHGTMKIMKKWLMLLEFLDSHCPKHETTGRNTHNADG